MNMNRRRWAIRPRDAAPSVGVIVEVQPGGESVAVQVGSSSATLPLEDVSRLRKALLDAQANALWERGGVW